MAITYIFNCDGCPASETNTSGEKPYAWGDMQVELRGFGVRYPANTTRHFTRLLCGDCQRRLERRADPLMWPHEKSSATDLLTDLAAYMDARADVSDGDEGVPEPNEEMALLDRIKCALVRLGGAQ